MREEIFFHNISRFFSTLILGYDNCHVLKQNNKEFLFINSTPR